MSNEAKAFAGRWLKVLRKASVLSQAELSPMDPRVTASLEEFQSSGRGSIPASNYDGPTSPSASSDRQAPWARTSVEDDPTDRRAREVANVE